MQRKIIWLLVLFSLLLPAASLAADSRVVIAIDGMTCNLCPIAIKKSLTGVAGVKEVKISFAEKKAWLLVTETVADKKLLAAISAAGPYTGEIIDRED